MYKQMMEIKEKASASAISAHKEAADTAKSVNVKSMEEMSKVAQKAAENIKTALNVSAKLGASEPEREVKEKKATCKNPDCDATWLPTEKPKFCHKCGVSQKSG
jgi:Zn finger protein HypA/HybF involved in hydrogenase expression